MKTICIQPGHVNIKFNIDPTLATQTGADGEAAFNLRIANRLSELLRSKGFTVVQTDANANNDQSILKTDFDFFLAIHAEGAPAGGAITAPDPSVDSVNAESKRIVDCIRKAYFSPYTQDTGIVEVPSIVTANMTKYYMWRLLSAKTPCGLIECGDLADPHDKVILADTERVATAIAKGICNAFSVSFDAPAPQPQPPTTTQPPLKGILMQIKQKLDELEQLIQQAQL